MVILYHQKNKSNMEKNKDYRLCLPPFSKVSLFSLSISLNEYTKMDENISLNGSMFWDKTSLNSQQTVS